MEIVHLPSVEELQEDLPAMVSTWALELCSGRRIDGRALERLCRMAVDRGLACVREALVHAAAVADGDIEAAHLPTDCYGSVLVDELLKEDDPLNALEAKLLTELLERCEWRMQEAADRLNISRVTLWRKLREHGISRD